MASGAALKGSTPYRGFHIGWPGSGKTGALASLLNVGYKIRVLSYEGNFEPLVGFADERALANLDVLVFQDKLKNGDKFMEPVGIPSAFNDGLSAMKDWKTTDENGVEVSLGSSKEWGLDTIVVVDSLTSLSAAAKRRAIKMSNKTPLTMTSAVWGLIVSDVLNQLEIMKAETNKFHLIVNSHKQVLGPADFVNQNDDKEENAEIKEAKMEMIKNGMIPPRVYPVGPTKPQSQTIHGMLPTMLEFEKVTKAGKDMRIIKTVGGSEIDIKIPGKGLKPFYSVETGLAEIFATMGYKAPGF